MPGPPDAVRETLILSGSLLVISVLLAGRLILDRARRGEVEPSETGYFRERDRRRGLVALILTVIAVLLGLSTRLQIRADVTQARIWAWTMMAVLVLALVLLVLGLLDWRANHLHAIRQGRALVEEHRALLTEAIKQYHETRTDRSEANGSELPPGGAG